METYKYRLLLQFANPNAPPFDTPQIMQLLDSAIAYYNTKSLTARNPKHIELVKILNSKTLCLILESHCELPYAGKALKLFSSYLVENGLSSYVSGKKLFKIRAEKPEDEKEVLLSEAELKLKAINLITISSEKTLYEVLKILQKENNND